MLKELTGSVIETISQNGAKSVFWAGIIEQVISPIPSVLIPMSAGFLLVPADLSFWAAILQIIRQISLPYALGASLGSSVLFLGALFGGQLLIAKFGKFFGLSLKNIERFKNKFTRGIKDEIIILLLIALPVTPISLVAASCGIIGIAPLEFYPLILAGTFIRSLFLGWLGWQMGEAYHFIGGGLSKMESLLSVVGALAALTLLGFLYYKRQKILKN